MAKIKRNAIVMYRSSAALPAAEVQLAEIRNLLRKEHVGEAESIDLGSLTEEETKAFIKGPFTSKCPADLVVVWRIDCLSGPLRTFPEFCGWLAALEQHDMELATVVDQFHPRIEQLEFLNGLLGIWAKNLGHRRAENARLSLHKARRRGSLLGRRRVRNDPQIKALRDAGHSIRQIAKITGVSPAAVQRALDTVVQNTTRRKDPRPEV